MLSLVFVVTIGNFALGFAAHTLWRGRWELSHRFALPSLPALPAWRLRIAWPRKKKSEPDESAPAAPVADAPAASAPATAETPLASEEAVAAPAEPIVFEEAAETVLQKLGAEVAGSQSFVEAAVETFRLGVGCYRHDLLGIEERLRAAAARRDEAALEEAFAALVATNAAWVAKQAGAAEMLGERRGALGKFELTGETLRGLLEEQSQRLGAVQAVLSTIDRPADLAEGCPQIIAEHCHLFALTHLLRDGMQDALAVVLRSEKRLGDVERRLHFDRDSTLYTRIGLEVLLGDWRRDDPGGGRAASLVLIDLDGCGRLNERFGVRTVDRLLDAFAGQVATTIRRDRGFDRMGRLGGQQFVAFLGDTGPRQATSAAERIRQTIRAMTIELIPHGEENPAAEFEMTATMAVAELGKRDDMSTMLAGLRSGLAMGKQSGGDRTVMDEGQGYNAIDPPIYQVKGRIISVPAIAFAR